MTEVRDDDEVRCGYCFTIIEPGEPTRLDDEEGFEYHEGCWSEHLGDEEYWYDYGQDD